MTTRDTVIKEIRTALRRRSGKVWSVTGGRGTAWGWIKIDAPPARRTCHAVLKPGAVTTWPGDYEMINTGERGGSMTIEDRQELARLLNKDIIHPQGESIPSGGGFYAEYVDRAHGRTPAKCGVVYWD